MSLLRPLVAFLVLVGADEVPNGSHVEVCASQAHNNTTSPKEQQRPTWEPGMPLSYWAEREMLATAYRSLASRSFNAGSGLGSHLTMSVGADMTNFLVIRYGVHWFEVTAENLLLVDNVGNILEGEGPVQGAAVSLHGPVHKALGAKARVIFHTHQPWFTSLACIKFGGLRMFHPEASIYDGRIGFDPVYTGNWPKGSKLGAMREGERLMRNPHLMGKDIGFLGNHGTMQLSASVEEALFDCFNLERLAKLQAHNPAQHRTILGNTCRSPHYAAAFSPCTMMRR